MTTPTLRDALPWAASTKSCTSSPGEEPSLVEASSCLIIGTATTSKVGLEGPIADATTGPLNVEEGDYEGAHRAFNRAMAIAQREEDSAVEMWTLANAASEIATCWTVCCLTTQSHPASGVPGRLLESLGTVDRRCRPKMRAS